VHQLISVLCRRLSVACVISIRTGRPIRRLSVIPFCSVVDFRSRTIYINKKNSLLTAWSASLLSCRNFSVGLLIPHLLPPGCWLWQSVSIRSPFFVSMFFFSWMLTSQHLFPCVVARDRYVHRLQLFDWQSLVWLRSVDRIVLSEWSPLVTEVNHSASSSQSRFAWTLTLTICTRFESHSLTSLWHFSNYFKFSVEIRTYAIIAPPNRHASSNGSQLSEAVAARLLLHQIARWLHIKLPLGLWAPHNALNANITTS